MIQAADQHECSECTHDYKSTSYVITAEDPAAVVGADENIAVPELTIDMNEGGILLEPDIQDAASNMMDVDYAPVKMIVMDGIVMGTNVCMLHVICKLS